MYLKDKLEDDELDLSMMQLTEIPVKVTQTHISCLSLIFIVYSIYTIGQDYNFFFNCFRKETINPAKSPVSLRQYSITRIMSSSNDGAVRSAVAAVQRRRSCDRRWR